MNSSTLLVVGACFVLAWVSGKKNPVIGGAFFCVALLLIFWAPGGLAL